MNSWNRDKATCITLTVCETFLVMAAEQGRTLTCLQLSSQFSSASVALSNRKTCEGNPCKGKLSLNPNSFIEFLVQYVYMTSYSS